MKAFESVDHTLPWKTLRELGIADHITSLLHNRYEEQKATVQTGCGDSDQFVIGKGGREGCIMSPTHFNLYAEKIMREAGIEESEEGIRIGGNIINILMVADDIILAAKSQNGLETLIEKVTQASEKYGLSLNLKKTKVMSNTEIDTFKR